MSLLVVAALMILPCLAGLKRGLDLQAIGTYSLIVSCVTYWIYVTDKRRAEAGEWRVPETFLHLLELIGGWPGALLAQRWVRHKCSKPDYQLFFWLIVLGYQWVAFDSMCNWQYGTAALDLLERLAPERSRR